MSNPVIQVENLGKRYRIGEREQYQALRDVLSSWVSAPWRSLQKTRRQGEGDGSRSGEYLWALRDVSFTVQQGDTLGIVGRNGAGKSTLLKILSRITRPTSGVARMRGRAGSLLEVGTGFHPELTGRENIYLNGAILGMPKSDIQRRFNEIVEFAEIGPFLDMPVKRYSSGMFMRLAFSIAAHLDPQILIVDEVLAVGDAAFQKKCLGKMGSVVKDGRTVLFVSHNMAAVQSLCNRALLLEHGRLVDQGPTARIIQRYLESEVARGAIPLDQREDRSGDGTARIASLHIKSADPDGVIRSSSRLRITIGYKSAAPVHRPQFVITILDHMETGIYLLHNDFTGGLPETLAPAGMVTCETGPINLTSGRCSLRVEMLKGNVRADLINSAGYFDVEEEDFYGSGMLPPRDWVLGILEQKWEVTPDQQLKK